ncbi:MAG: hypothetical protein GY822_16200 [Deltaproteobacteria bacterium]|nr:hypothetical protein [Deltaproteobacteria bacterium]
MSLTSDGYTDFNYGNRLADGSFVVVGTVDNGPKTFSASTRDFEITRTATSDSLILLHFAADLTLTNVKSYKGPKNMDSTDELGSLTGVTSMSTGYIVQGSGIKGQLFDGDIDSQNGMNWSAAFALDGSGPVWTLQFSAVHHIKYETKDEELWLAYIGQSANDQSAKASIIDVDPITGSPQGTRELSFANGELTSLSGLQILQDGFIILERAAKPRLSLFSSAVATCRSKSLMLATGASTERFFADVFRVVLDAPSKAV